MARSLKLRYEVVIAILLCLIIIIPTYQHVFSGLSDLGQTGNYHIVEGALETDSYSNYPYKKTNLEIGFSSYGEMVTPQGRGLSYDGLELIAEPDIASSFYPVEGWLLKYSYLNHITESIDDDLVYALYSDIELGELEKGRSQNLLTEPIDIIYDGPRRFVAEIKVHVMRDYVNIIDVKQTLIFNKVYKHTLILMDIDFLKNSYEADPLHISFSRRVGLPVAQEDVNFQHRLETPYNQPLNSAEQGYYDLATISINPKLTAYAAYWPSVSRVNLYEIEDWNNPSLSSLPLNVENEPALLIAEWEGTISPGDSKRLVTVYGVVDGATDGNDELQYQLDIVFNPWDLKDALKPNTVYDWILVGRNSGKDLEFAKDIIADQKIDAIIGFDGVNSTLPDIPDLISSSSAGYYDELGRLHFKKESIGKPVTGSNMIVVGSLYANMGGEYFNDLADVFITSYVKDDLIELFSINKNLLYAPSSTREQAREPSAGTALISTYRDLNGTVGLSVWGWYATDTLYATLFLSQLAFEETPDGATSVIIEFDYTKKPYEDGFFNIIEYDGTILSWGMT